MQRINRERGGALILVMILIVITTVLGALLLVVPKAGLDREISSEEKERALLAADAGLRDALIRLCQPSTAATYIDASTVPSPPGTAYYSQMAPHAYGKPVPGVSTGYWYNVSQLSGTNLLRVNSWGSQATVLRDGQGNLKTIQSQVEAILARPAPPPPLINAAINFWWPVSNGGPTYGITGSGSVTGNDLSPPSGGSPLPVYGVAFDPKQPWSGGSGNPTGGVTGPSPGSLGYLPSASSQGPAGSWATVPASSTMSSLYTNYLSNPPALPTTTIATPAGAPLTVGNMGTPSQPVLLVVRPSSLPPAGQPIVNVNGSFNGILAVDLSYMTPVPSSIPNATFQTSVGGSINGIAYLNGPSSGSTTFGQPIFNQAVGAGPLSGTMIVRITNDAGNGNVPIANVTSANGIQYGSGPVLAAMNALISNSGYRIVSYRVVQ